MILVLASNIMIYALLAVNENLLALIQLTVSFKSLLICLLIYLRQVSLVSKLVSSAKR